MHAQKQCHVTYIFFYKYTLIEIYGGIASLFVSGIQIFSCHCINSWVVLWNLSNLIPLLCSLNVKSSKLIKLSPYSKLRLNANRFTYIL